MSQKINIAIFISGRGSNMKALVEACENPDFPARVVLVAANDPNAEGLKFAQDKNIPTESVCHKEYDTREDFERAFMERLEGYDIDIICLAGFMRVLTSYFIEQWPKGHILNIHPSLLPKYKGLNTHQRAIEAGDAEAGCSVHKVVADLDSGDVIVQKAVPILEGDTANLLAQRVLEQEHLAYPQALKIVAEKLLKDVQ